MTEILLYGEVGYDFDSLWLEKRLASADRDVSLRVHSPGGDVFEGVAISNVIRHAQSNGKRIKAYVDSLAASAASYMCLPCDEVIAGPGSVFMIHPPSAFCYGQADEMRDVAHTLDVCEGAIRDLYVRRTGRNPEDVQEAMRNETWMTADEAREWGLVDRVEKTESPNFTLVDQKWSAAATNSEFAAFAQSHPALREKLSSYGVHANLLKARLEEAEEVGILPSRYTPINIEKTVVDDGSGGASEAGSGGAPLLFANGWDVVRVNAKGE